MHILKRMYAIRPEIVFITLAVIFGLLLVFAVKPLHGNDEIVHFPRAYQVSEGRLWTEHLGGYDYGGHLPVQIKQFNDGFREQIQSDHTDQSKLEALQARYSRERLADGPREPLAFTSAGVYSAWSYAPPAAGILVARTLNLPLTWYLYLGRIIALLIYIVLVYFALKYLPFGKIFLLVVALLPTALSQAATTGIDGVVNGASWLLLALTLAVFARTLKLSGRLVAAIALIALFLATTKQAYLPVALLPLFVPANHYPLSYKKVWLWRLLFGGSLVAASLWYVGATSPIAEIMHFIQRPGLYVDEAAQLHYVFQHMLQFLGMIFVQPFTVWSANIYAGIVGIVTNKVIFLPIAVIILLYLTIFITSLHKERPHIAKRDQLFVVGASLGALLGSFILINLALYLSFTRVGYDHVEGLQGRYFLPLLPLLGVVLHVAWPRLFLKISDRLAWLVVYPSVIIGLTSALLLVR
jgi:uncharacterized membrane protein